jgi:hypothetical protein
MLSDNEVQAVFCTARDCPRCTVDEDGEAGEVGALAALAEPFSTIGGRELDGAPVPSYAGGASSGASVGLDLGSGLGGTIMSVENDSQDYFGLLYSCPI